jgi:uncharacterized delta-60 repeat protein
MKSQSISAVGIASLIVTTAFSQITPASLDFPPYDTAFGVDGYLTEALYPDAFSHVEDTATHGTRVYGVGTDAYSLWISCRNEDGTLDTGFGNHGNGYLETGSRPSHPKLAVSQSHGLIVAASTGTSSSAVQLVRHDATTGAGDTTFGPGRSGMATFRLTHGTTRLIPSEVTDLVLDESREKIYLTIQAISSTGGSYTCLARLDWNGSLDTEFGSSGLVVIHYSGTNDRHLKVAVTPDGGCYTAGRTVSGGSTAIYVKRLTASGNTDSTFGTHGYAVISTFGSPGVASILVDSLNRPLVVGDYAATSSRRQFYALRLTTGGVLDASFNSIGYRTGTFVGSTSVRESLEVTDAALSGSGNLVLVGHRADAESNQYAGVARLTSSGALDTAYSVNGSAQFNLRASHWRIGTTSVSIDALDRIVVGGWFLADELSSDQGFLLRSRD